ncbi:MAG TPA: hypothetical protein VI933_04260 [archaeon]|nr:hypothetical protein [archaeon]
MSSSHSRRVYHGVECEHRVSEIFGLERKEKRGGYQPDIYDEAQRVIGEVKAFGNHERTIIAVEQFRKYSAEAERLNFSLQYFYVRHNGGDVTDIYVVDRSAMEKFVREKEHKRTRWNLRQKHVDQISVVEDRRQKLLGRASRKKVLDAIVQGNTRGAWIRIGEDDLESACPRHVLSPEGILVHYKKWDGFLKNSLGMAEET